MSIKITICHLVIFCQFVIFPGKTQAPDEVKIHVIDDDEDFIVNLKKVDSFLANENLPVWTVSQDADSKLVPDERVMRRLSRFSMYQDPDQSSAAVYYHKINGLYGTIDARYVIKDLPVINLNNPYHVTDGKSGVIKRKSESCLHRNERSVEKRHRSSPESNLRAIGLRWFNASGTLIRPRRNSPEVVYIKVLILISFDLTQKLFKSDQTNTLVLFDLLNLFNSVDMLFSKVEEPRIKINIAGIIVGTTLESFPNIDKCTKKRDNIIYIDPTCSNYAIKRYLRGIHDVISPDSYDAAIFLTRYTPQYEQFFSKYLLGGVTSGSETYPYDLRKAEVPSVPIITAAYLNSAGSFHIVAHELAHALRYNTHDKEPYVDKNNKCNAYLMKTHAECCKNCLSWSSDTKKHFKKFFNSRERCFFINKPLSLEKPGPRETWSADEQCKCYGYYKATDPEVSLMKKIFGTPSIGMCDTNLYCLDNNGKSHEVPFPMDGTPCDEGKVCWKRKCERLPIEKCDGDTLEIIPLAELDKCDQ